MGLAVCMVVLVSQERKSRGMEHQDDVDRVHMLPRNFSIPRMLFLIMPTSRHFLEGFHMTCSCRCTVEGICSQRHGGCVRATLLWRGSYWGRLVATKHVLEGFCCVQLTSNRNARTRQHDQLECSCARKISTTAKAVAVCHAIMPGTHTYHINIVGFVCECANARLFAIFRARIFDTQLNLNLFL